MKLIDMEKVLSELCLSHKDIIYIDKNETAERIRKIPSIDIVRCQDCKYWVCNFNGCARNPCTEPWYATDFCNYGVKKGADDDR